MKTKPLLSKLLCTLLMLLSCQSIALGSNSIPSSNLSANNSNSEQISNEIDSDNIDSDMDGIVDSEDNCPDTRVNLVVYNNGCPPVVACDLEPLRQELRVFFSENSSEIKPQYYAELAKVARRMTAPSTTSLLVVEGYANKGEITSDNNADSDNTDISLRRANAVKQYLVMNYNIDPESITVTAFGATRPIAPNDTEEGRAMNRRVYMLLEE